MALNKANITWTIKQIAKMNGLGRFKFDNVYQRSLVWEQMRKSGLIHSLIEGFPVPPLYARRVDGKIYDFLDGKQRLNTVCEFLNNEFSLVGISDVELDDGSFVDVNGMKFEDLPEELQDRVKDYNFVIYYYEDITDEQVRVLFCKLNNGKPLSAKEKNIAYCVDLMTVANIAEHEVFQKILTAKGLESRKNIPMVMKIHMMVNDFIENASFESKDFNEVIQDTKLTDEQKEMILRVLDKFLAIYNEIPNRTNAKLAKTVMKKIGSETHFISLMPFVKKAIEEEVSDALMADFLIDAFGNPDGVLVSAEYAEACKGGSAKNVNIKRRNDEIQKAWDRFFAPDVEDGNRTVWETEDLPFC